MDEKGQMFVEFAFCLPIFLLAFVIISVSFWGLETHMFVKPHLRQRHYSVTNNPGRSAIVAKAFLRIWRRIVC